MKIEHIESALMKLEEEDSAQLQDIEEDIEELEMTQMEQSELLEDIRKKISELEFLDGVKRNDLRNFHMYMPLIEIPTIAGIVYGIFTLNTISIWPLVGMMTMVGCLLDITYLNEMVYDKIDDNPNPIKRLISLINKTMKNKKEITLDLLYLYNDQTVAEERLKEIKQQLESAENKKIKIRNELSFIEGKQIGLEAMKLSSDIEELNDNTEVVTFVNNKRLELKP